MRGTARLGEVLGWDAARSSHSNEGRRSAAGGGKLDRALDGEKRSIGVSGMDDELGPLVYSYTREKAFEDGCSSP